MSEYYKAYDKRYRQVHGQGLSWASDAPSPILGEMLAKYGIGTDSSILELGCGEGRDAIALLKKGCRLLATDVSPEAVEYCRSLAPGHRSSFQVLDACEGKLDERFDFIYAIAVIHMLTEDSHRAAFLNFVREHLAPKGLALILSQGDGEGEYCGDPALAFEDAERTHGGTGRSIRIASTTFRMVSFPSFEAELSAAGLDIVEKGICAVEPDFPVMMYALVTSKD